jgi:hypothetical protein
LASRRACGPSRSFKGVTEARLNKNHEDEQIDCFNYEGQQDVNVATVNFVKMLGIGNQEFQTNYTETQDVYCVVSVEHRQ